MILQWIILKRTPKLINFHQLNFKNSPKIGENFIFIGEIPKKSVIFLVKFVLLFLVKNY